jgi:Golgi nucleoside diphosphatase
MKGLVAFAEEHVPVEDRNSTVLALSATAGLRMISEEARNAILDSCFSWLLKNSPFIIRRDLISVISGKEGPVLECGYIAVQVLMHRMMNAAEGAYGWLSINFLHGRDLLLWRPVPKLPSSQRIYTLPHLQDG